VKGAFMKKLNVNEMMNVNGGKTAVGEKWDLENRVHIIYWDDGTTTREPMLEIQVEAKRV